MKRFDLKKLKWKIRVQYQVKISNRLAASQHSIKLPQACKPHAVQPPDATASPRKFC
jgi:hypothetical protein